MWSPSESPARRTKCCSCSTPPPARTPSQQAKNFGAAIGVTGIILAKLDGTAKGGVVISIRDQLNIPVKFIGLGETPQDIETFDPARFVNALFGDNG